MDSSGAILSLAAHERGYGIDIPIGPSRRSDTISWGSFTVSSSDLLRYLVRTLEELDLPYAIGGSIAAMTYATYRSTIDIDVLVDLKLADVDRLEARFPEPDYYFDDVAIRKAVEERRQFNILHIPSGMKVDVFLPTGSFTRSQIARGESRPVFDDIEARISPPEELIVSKLMYYEEGGSDKHVNDIAAMLAVSSDLIDRERVESLAKEAGVLDLWRQVLDRIGSG